MDTKKVYHSFEDLLESNRSLFQFIEGSVSPELLRAVWNARQGELDTREERIRTLEKEVQVGQDHLTQRKALAQQREKNMRELGERLALLETELEMRMSERDQMQAEMARIRESRDVLEKTLAQKCRQLEEQTILRHQLEVALKAEEASMRTQKSLNDQMSAELLKLTSPQL